MKVHAVGRSGDDLAGAVALIYVLQFHKCHGDSSFRRKIQQHALYDEKEGKTTKREDIYRKFAKKVVIIDTFVVSVYSASGELGEREKKVL